VRQIIITAIFAGFGLIVSAGVSAAPVTFTFSDQFIDPLSPLNGTELEVTLVVDDGLSIGASGSFDGTAEFTFDQYSGTYTTLFIDRLVSWGAGAQPNFSLLDNASPDQAVLELSFSDLNSAVLDSVEDLIAAALAGTLAVGYDLNFEATNGEQALEGLFSSVGVSEVPLPAAMWLFASGLAGFVAISRRRQSRA
jgi:hypothetical protein